MRREAFFNTMKIVDYIKETQGELKHVSWPTRRQVISYTSIVIGISVLTAVMLGFFDFVFQYGLNLIISR